jgi:SulP family sulfate permease
VAGMVHSLTLLAVILFAAPYARFIPLCVLAAMLFVVSYNMGEWREIPALLRLSRLEIATWLVTFLLTVFADLTVAVEAGMILAALVYIQKVTQTTTVTRVTEQYLKDGYVHILQHKEIPPYVAIFRIHGPFLFGATDKIDEIISQIPELPHIVVIRLRNMTALDATGLQALENLVAQVRASGRAIVFCGARQQPQQMIKDAEFHECVGNENICENVTVGLERARSIWAEKELREAKISLA